MPIATYLLLPFAANSANTGFIHGQGNNVWLFKCYVPGTITVSLIAAVATTSDAGNFAGIGLYDLDGNLLVDSGPMAMTGAANEVLSAAIAPVLVPQDTYWLAATSDSATAELLAADYNASIEIASTSPLGQATNVSAGGQLPATTGIITTPIPASSVDRLAPLIKIQA